MGRLLHPDYDFEAGIDCSDCTPGLWPADETPKQLRMVAHEMVPEPGYPNPPNGVVITMEQRTSFPCHWIKYFAFEGQDWQAGLLAADCRLHLHCLAPYNQYAFWSLISPCVLGPWVNGPPANHPAATGGRAYIIDHTPEYVIRLSIEMNFQPDRRALYDDRPTDDPAQRCIRLTGRQAGGSCLFLIEP
ncbi:MAG: hypothetical protein U9N44_00810 [Chloroflexota bacterium]|nr:hypothetical protein [Chloroflexota bacterium]